VKGSRAAIIHFDGDCEAEFSLWPAKKLAHVGI